MPTKTMSTLGQVAVQRELIQAEHDCTVYEAVQKMVAANHGAILVVDGDKLKGIFTERDLMTRVVARGLDPKKTRLGEVMTDKLVVAGPDDPYRWGLQRMVRANVRHLPLVDRDRVVGMVSRRTLMSLEVNDLVEELVRVDPSSLFI